MDSIAVKGEEEKEDDDEEEEAEEEEEEEWLPMAPRLGEGTSPLWPWDMGDRDLPLSPRVVGL